MPYYIMKILSDYLENISTNYDIDAEAKNKLGYSIKQAKEHLQKMIDFIPRLKWLENQILQMFYFMEKELQGISDDRDQPEEMSKKLHNISKLLEYMVNYFSRHLLSGEEMETLPLGPRQQSYSDVQMPKIMSDNWLNLQIEENILDSPMMSNFQMSFDILSINLRLCLLTFAVFPEEQLIKKKPLIYWWIGEGFITKSRNKTAEEAGEETFMELIDEGLIQPFHKTQKNPLIYGCTVHPWIHRMLISMARQANFFDLDTTGKVTNGHQNSRRFVLDERSSTNDYQPKGELSAIINMREIYPSFSANFFSKNDQKIKVLQLGRWQSSPRHHIEIEEGKFLDKLKTQKQLKYLSLRGVSRITTLPSSIVGCQNLEILDLRACHNLETLPFDIGSFKKLTHFDVSECYLLENLPNGLEKLSSIEVLKGFVVNHWRKNSCSLASLLSLEKLIKLSINIGIAYQAMPWFRVVPTRHSSFNLRILVIKWQMRSTSVDQTSEEEERIRLNLFRDISFPNLEKLDLRCFPDTMLPSWISPENMGNLKRLYMRGGMLKTLLPVSENLNPWKVEILRLNYLKNFRFQESFDVQKEFPHLSYLERINCNAKNYLIPLIIEFNRRSRMVQGTLGSEGSDGLHYDANIKWRLDDGWEKLKIEMMDGRSSRSIWWMGEAQDRDGLLKPSIIDSAIFFNEDAARLL
ncbi:RNI-like superfamily protein [Abeliophyllum distichum]|uniref:RNI-like superfamily protein n=1 Tax=Abeliophyllum distichum TaxID=126358 RepID=A0ABD1UJ58_9LAMI